MVVNKYNSKTAHELNDNVYANGIAIQIRNPHDATEVKQINHLEKILEKYSKKFGEQAVIAEWGQPFGGPAGGFRVHRESEVMELLKAYESAGINGIHPRLGTYFDYSWLKKKKEHLKNNPEPQQFNLKGYFRFAFGQR